MRGGRRATATVHETPPDRAVLLAGYRSQQREATRSTTLLGAVVALVALPAWALFDVVMVPDQAGRFLVVRLVSELVMAACCGALWWPRLGARWPEQLSLVAIAVPELAIAWMVPRSGSQLEAYLLGMSLAIYATAFLLVWRWPMTVALITGITLAIIAFSDGVRPGLTTQQITTISFYLATASALAIAAQVYRDRKGWQQHLTQAELEVERRRNQVLVEELDQLTREDPLTSVGNRRAWDEQLTREFLRASRSGRPLSVLVCDLDHFKAVNDERGHNVGDTVLRIAAAAMVDRAKSADFVARLGGDEFAVLCPDTSLAVAAQLADEIAEQIRTADFPTGVAMTCSIGVADLDRGDTTTESLYHRADCALYDAKATRDTIHCAEPGKRERFREHSSRHAGPNISGRSV